MVLAILSSLASLLSSEYYIPTIAFVVSCFAIRAYAQGRTTNRERDLHARVVLITGGFTPLGLTLIQSLAMRGAHIIALSSDPIDSPDVATLITVLRVATSNEKIFAEECKIDNAESVRAFCTRFLTTGEDQRLDAVVFVHEYQNVGHLWGGDAQAAEAERQFKSIGTFLMITLLLPALLVAPVERDIRIVNVINPLYAAAIPTFSPLPTELASTFIQEGRRSLRTAIFTRHLQRVLDALPSSADVPVPDGPAGPRTTSKEQRSNIVALSVSPGISRSDTIAPLLRADRTSTTFSVFGFIIYIFLQPLLRILTKSPAAAVQSVLHVLFLPTPFKSVPKKKTVVSATVIEEREAPEEILKPGALYSDCAVVQLRIPVLSSDSPASGPNSSNGSKQGEKTAIVDDGELGGEEIGRLVWEEMELKLKEAEKGSSSTASKNDS